jgi:hypothetical protein
MPGAPIHAFVDIAFNIGYLALAVVRLHRLRLSTAQLNIFPLKNVLESALAGSEMLGSPCKANELFSRIDSRRYLGKSKK